MGDDSLRHRDIVFRRVLAARSGDDIGFPDRDGDRGDGPAAS
jgi:hypothetical protein